MGRIRTMMTLHRDRPLTLALSPGGEGIAANFNPSRGGEVCPSPLGEKVAEGRTRGRSFPSINSPLTLALSPRGEGIFASFAATLLAVLMLCAGGPVASAEPRHGLSIFGDLKYAADFKHFDYVNPDASKGGRLVTMGTGGANTFDSLNEYILKGDKAQGLEMLFDPLMAPACLLYTSPSPRDRTRSRMPSSA